MDDDEVRTLEALKSLRRSVVRPSHRCTPAYREDHGDELLMAFASTVDAVTCAVKVKALVFHESHDPLVPSGFSLRSMNGVPERSTRAVSRAAAGVKPRVF
jgi:hypothetical protein